VISAALLLISADIRAEEEAAAAGQGPDVQIMTESNPGSTSTAVSNSGGPLLMPVERLPFGVSLNVNAGYDTNVATSVTDQGSFYTSASLGVTYSFGTERTRVNTSWGASLTYYADDAGSGFGHTQPDSSLNLSISHQVNQRLTLNSTINLHYGIEPDFTSGATENRRSGNYFYTGDSISASFQWLDRVSTVTSYSIGILRYEDEPLSSFLDREDHSISQQLRFLVLPMTTVVGQYGFSASVYDLGARNFYSHTVSLGLEQTLGPRTQGSLSIGAELYSTEQTGDSFSPYASGSLSFALGEKTSLSWSAQYSTQEANIVEASTRKNFSTGLQLSYALTPRISASLSGSYNHSDYKGQKVLLFDPERFIIFYAQPAFTEDSFDAGVNLGYNISPRMSGNFGAHFTDVESDLSERPYSRLRFSAGLGYSF
jgi:hypothetical protein